MPQRGQAVGRYRKIIPSSEGATQMLIKDDPERHPKLRRSGIRVAHCVDPEGVKLWVR